MAFVPLLGFQTNLAATLLNSATQMLLPASAASTIASLVGVGDYSILALNNGVNFEIVYVTGVTGGAVNIMRAQEGTTAFTFGTGTDVRFVWTPVGIQETATAGTPVTITGINAASVTGSPNYVVDVPETAITAGTGISVTGAFPNFTITNTDPGIPVPPTEVTGSGVAQVTSILTGYNVNVDPVIFTNGTGISVSGTYPNFTITNTAPSPASPGTVTVVTPGTGIAITGTPSIAPVVGLANSGVTAGTYGGITVNAQGQITNMAANLITSITSNTTSLTVTTPTVGEVQLTQALATTATPGIVPLAAASSAASNNASDSTSAVTPAGINAVIAALPSTAPTISGAASLVPLSSALYTTSVGGSTVAINLASGKKALVTAFMEMTDPANPTIVQTFAFGLFNGATLLAGNSSLPSSARTLSTVLTGPITGSLVLQHTALAGTTQLDSYALNVIYT